MKKFILFLLLVVLAGAVWYFWGSEKENIPQFRTVKVDTGTIVATVSTTGSVEPTTLVQVGSQISGTIEKIYADYNDRVKSGQVICELDKTTLKARVAQSRANLMKAEAQVGRGRANLLKAENDLKRSRSLHKDRLISSSELEKEEAAHKVSAAELEVAEAEVKQVEAALRMSRANLSYTTIKSPINGVVISRNIDIGQTVAASFQAPVLFEIAENLDKLHVLASVDEADIGKIEPGQPVSFTVDAYPDLRFAGETLQIRLSPTIDQNVVTYTVVVEVENPEGKLLPGMTANLDFEVGRTPENSLRVSNMALRFEPDPAWVHLKEAGYKKITTRSRYSLWVLNQGKLKAIPVKTGITDGIHSRILEGEIQRGQEVVLGVMELEPEGSDMRSPFQFRRPRPTRKK